MTTLSAPEPSRPRGRPPGRTAKAEATRSHLYATALRLFATRGYAETTMREIGDAAGVSAGLLYRYFPAKHAIVLALYDQLSEAYARRVLEMPAGSWRDRFLFALRTSLEVLAPHREILRALVPVLVADETGGVLAPHTSLARRHVQASFRRAVVEARDRPKLPIAVALGNLLYVLHLGVLLMWLLDRSPGTRATAAAVALLDQGKSLAALAVRMPFAHRFILTADAVVREALLPGEEGAS